MDFVSEKIKDAKEHSVKYFLHRHFTKTRPNRSKLKIHASDLYGDWEEFCPRERALRWLLHQDSQPERLTTSLRMTFEMGKTVHDLAVHALAAEGVIVGDWSCSRCDHVYSRRVMPAFCENCQANRTFLRHHEIAFQSPISGVSGSIDCFFQGNTPGLIPVEIKTLDKEQFKDLVMPKAEHRWRTQLYLRLISEAGDLDPWVNENVDCSHGIVLYISKGGYGCADSSVKAYGWHEKFSPFKEYRVDRNDANSDAALALAMAYKVYRDGAKNLKPNPKGLAAVPLPERICAVHSAKRARKCGMVKACFGDPMEAMKT